MDVPVVDAPAPDTGAPDADPFRADAGPVAGGCGTVMPDLCDESGGVHCFVLPVEATTLADGTTPPDWSCGAPVATGSTVPVDVSGVVRDFQEGGPISSATVAASSTASFASPLATTTAGGAGGYAMVLPSGTPSRLHWRVMATDALDSYAFFSSPIDVSGSPVTVDLRSMSTLTAQALPAFIGVSRTPGLGLVAGRMRDCGGSPVMHAIVTLSTTSSVGATCPTFLPGTQVYYFSALDPDLPIRRNLRIDTNTDGMFLVVEVPVTAPVYVQVWGFASAGDVPLGYAGLRLLAEEEVVVFGDAWHEYHLVPSEGPLP